MFFVSVSNMCVCIVFAMNMNMFVYVCMYECVLVCMYICLCVSIYICMTTSIYLLYVGFDYTYIDINTLAQGIKSFYLNLWYRFAHNYQPCMYVCMYVYMYVCMYVWVCMCLYIYGYMYV